jgi:hypothetical protein
VCKRWLQKCRQCNKESPCTVPEAELELAIFKAVSRAAALVDDIYTLELFAGGFDETHEIELCEKCGYGLRQPCNGCDSHPKEIEATTSGAGGELEKLRQQLKLPHEAMFKSFVSYVALAVHLKPSSEQTDAKRQATHAIRTAIEYSDMELEETTDKQMQDVIVESGSVGKGTDWPSSDLDIVVFVKDFGRSCAYQLQVMLKTINQMPGLKGDISARTSSLAFDFDISGSTFKVDLLLAGKLADDACTYIKLAPLERILWSASCSLLQKRFVRGRTVCFRALVRIVKFWRQEKRLSKNDLSSYLIELLLARASDDLCVSKEEKFEKKLDRSGQEVLLASVFHNFLAKLSNTDGVQAWWTDFYTEEHLKIKGCAIETNSSRAHGDKMLVVDPGNPTNDVCHRMRRNTQGQMPPVVETRPLKQRMESFKKLASCALETLSTFDPESKVVIAAFGE